MLRDLNQLRLLATLGRVHSLSAASAALRVPLATISRQLKALESELGQKMLDRSARRYKLTDAGISWVRLAAHWTSELEEATQTLRGEQQSLSGEIRVTTPNDFATRFLPSAIAQFNQMYPNIRISMLLTGRRVNLIDERVDLAIRVGAIHSTELIPKLLRNFTRGIYASPAVAQLAPKEWADAKLLRWIHLGEAGPVSMTMQHRVKNSQAQLQFEPKTSADSVAMCALLVQAGAGVAILPDDWMQPMLQDGSVVKLWPEWQAPPVGVHVLYADRNLPARVRAFLDFMVAHFEPTRFDESRFKLLS